MKKLSKKFYQRDDVVAIAKELLGKRLCTNFNGKLTCGIISETEAYAGEIDRASHAYGGRRTPRTEIMYAEGGTAYVYLCYGVHHLFNIVTHNKDVPHAILIRGVFPETGIETMMKRRKQKAMKKNFSAGPGTASQALGIHTKHSGISLLGDQIWLEETKIVVPEKEIVVGPRIGVDYAGEDAKLPYRFLWRKK
ncbi:MAG TPA: DNA-3-methyladenine glycosylase [Bacteroidia bacterium]|jgi:DNA-3-methyladenine glycosylase|nr:DNA-3-methyladenine glycosylase [Bacteroidia bacterium]